MFENNEYVLSLIAPFYAGMYDRAYDTINAFARTEAGREAFTPESDAWDEFVGQLALQQIFGSAFTFSTHADEDFSALKYLLDDNGTLYMDLDDELDPLCGWMIDIEPDRSHIRPHVTRPLPSEPLPRSTGLDETSVRIPSDQISINTEGLLGLTVEVLAILYGSSYLNVTEVSLAHRKTGAVKPIGPGWEETKRRLALELTKLTPRLFRKHEHDPVSMKYYIDNDGEMIRDIDDLLGSLEEHIDQPGSILEGATGNPLPGQQVN